MSLAAPHLLPDRARPEIEWSVALDRHGLSLDRHVIYGLDDATIRAVLAARGHDASAAFAALEAAVGPPVQIAVGKDGQRTKLYWFLEGDDPNFLGADLRPGAVAPRLKHYRMLQPPDAGLAFGLLPGPLRPHLEWLLAHQEVQAAGLFHLVLLSRERPPRYSAVHVGLAPDWEGLVAGDRGLLRPELVAAFLDRLGLSDRFDAVRQHLLSPPMAWTCYLSLALRPDGFVGANVYARADPVVRRAGALAIVEPGQGGVRPRPVVVEVALAGWPHIPIRFRAPDDQPAFATAGGWHVAYAPPEDGPAPPEFLDALAGLAERPLADASPLRPGETLTLLRRRAEVASARLVPDMRRSEGASVTPEPP